MIKILPQDALEQVEFDKIREYLLSYCISDDAKKTISSSTFLVQRAAIESSMDEILELKSLLTEGISIPIKQINNIDSILKLLGKTGYALDLDNLIAIKDVILSAFSIQNFFFDVIEVKLPLINEIFNQVSWDKKLPKLFDPIFDEEGQIRKTASPELARIFKKITNKEIENQKIFANIVGKYRDKGWLTENKESYRNGRRVLTVPAEHKRRITGIIHDESATGKTSFLEPQEVVGINNDLMELELEKRKEIRKIILTLCDTLRPFIHEIGSYQRILIRVEVILAKAKLAYGMDAQKPHLQDKPTFQFKAALHPILLITNKDKGLKTVPFELCLAGLNRILVISGPNAGGKSITMKAVALLQLMAQFGLLIPVHEDSKLGIFDRICTDIGDQQSIENELSTYSSRLKNMSSFLKAADDKTLILIDEFGSGTDPKIGGAIAEAILRELNHTGAFGVITTHYNNLKTFAFRTRGLVNGAMLFDEEHLSPTYELKIGKPGSSFAFEVAQKSGLSGKILKYAKSKTGKNLRETEGLLTDLVRDKKKVDEQLERLASKEREVDKLLNSYNELKKDYEFKRRKLKVEKKTLALQDQTRASRAIESELKKIKREKTTGVEKAKDLQRSVQKKQITLNEEIKELQQSIHSVEVPTDFVLKEGQFAKHRTDGWVGEILKIDKKKVTMLMGNMTVTVLLNELLPAREHLEINSQRRIKTDLKINPSNVESKLDIRGYTYKDAEAFLQEFLDQAIIANHAQLTIIHGRGNGVLKKLLYKKLKEYKDVKRVWHPEDEQGGEGISYINM